VDCGFVQGSIEIDSSDEQDPGCTYEFCSAIFLRVLIFFLLGMVNFQAKLKTSANQTILNALMEVHVSRFAIF